MAVHRLYAAHRNTLGTPPLVHQAHNSPSRRKRSEVTSGDRQAKGSLKITQGNIIQSTRTHRDKTTSTKLSACCAPILGMLWLPLKLYWVNTVPIPAPVSRCCC